MTKLDYTPVDKREKPKDPTKRQLARKQLLQDAANDPPVNRLYRFLVVIFFGYQAWMLIAWGISGVRRSEAIARCSANKLCEGIVYMGTSNINTDVLIKWLLGSFIIAVFMWMAKAK